MFDLRRACEYHTLVGTLNLSQLEPIEQLIENVYLLPILGPIPVSMAYTGFGPYLWPWQVTKNGGDQSQYHTFEEAVTQNRDVAH